MVDLRVHVLRDARNGLEVTEGVSVDDVRRQTEAEFDVAGAVGTVPVT